MEKLTDLELVKLSKTNSERTMNELQDRASSLLLLNLRWKEVEKVLDSAQSSLEERFKELKRKEEFVLKLKDFDKRCEQIELEKKDLEQRFKDTESKEKELAEQSKQLEMKRGLASALQPQVKTDAAGIFSVKYSVDHSSRAHLRFCVNMDGKDLQMFLNERLNKHDSVGTEVALALQLSSDPAKLVLDAMHRFYPPHLSKGGKEFEGNAARRSCILLLEQLNGLSPEIKPCVREKAMEHAPDWLTKMRVKSGHELEVLGFLWLLAAFKLADNYEVEELLKYLQFVHDHIKSDEILKALVLGERISYLIFNWPRTQPIEVRHVLWLKFKLLFESLSNKWKREFIATRKSPLNRKREFITTRKSPLGATTAASSEHMASKHLKGSKHDATTGVPSPVCPASASPSSTAPATIPTPEQQANQVDT